MNAFLNLSDDRRRLLCEQAQAKLGRPQASIEKDFWVCWTLRELFDLPAWGPNLTFKGGTSLSKGWKLIQRFSEDIDIVVNRDFLGFGGDQSPETAPSNKQRKHRLDALKSECQRRIRGELTPTLEARIQSLMPKDRKWAILPASLDEDPDQQTLLFHYPTVLPGFSKYVRSVVKIEMGARSDIEPSGTPVIRPYLTEAYPEILGPGEFPVRALAPERTFWEKAMLLHEETYRPANKPRKARLARHYYDLWCLIEKGIAAKAARDESLFARTAAHREIFFNWSWMDYTTLRPGALRLIPMEHQIPEWRQDYQTMLGEMFFGEVPKFDDILRVVGEFQRAFNTR
jgi:hypothetical protein